MKIGINGFGRIGRLLLRAIYDRNLQNELQLTEINSTSNNPKNDAYLLKYDTVHGIFPKEIKTDESTIFIDNNHKIKTHNSPDIKELKWENVDLVFDCTGAYTNIESLKNHIQNGAKKVILSAPAKDKMKTFIYNVNHKEIKEGDDIISIGSCTTNCFIPIAKIVDDIVGIEKGFMTTVHAYTNDQKIVDANHKSDLRRSRAAANSIIPTSSGVAKLINVLMPHLTGKLEATCFRVPVVDVSCIDFCFSAKKKISVEELNLEVKNRIENSEFKSSLRYIDEPLVSSDFIHTQESAIFDSLETKIVDNDFIRVCAWYDNEWSFVQRMIDIALFVKNGK